jgi:hypothetical protein
LAALHQQPFDAQQIYNAQLFNQQPQMLNDRWYVKPRRSLPQKSVLQRWPAIGLRRRKIKFFFIRGVADGRVSVLARWQEKASSGDRTPVRLTIGHPT